MNTYLDGRGYSAFDLFPCEGQINISDIRKDVIKAFHRHQKQIDCWFCVKGHLMVKLVKDDREQTIYLSEKKPFVLEIPKNTWHGFRALEDSTLLYYVDKKFNPEQPDEERSPFDSFGVSWEVKNE